MIRPEAKDQIMRWREVLIGSCALILGLWWLLGPSRLLFLPGAACLLAGVALILIGVQRARFRAEGQGPGTVQLDEGQITYFGPLSGGAIALREIDKIVLDPSFYPAHWRVTQSGVPELLIPVNADGADLLFDAFATLPGLKMQYVLSMMKSRKKHPIVIWKRDAAPSTQLSPH